MTALSAVHPNSEIVVCPVDLRRTSFTGGEMIIANRELSESEG